MSGAAFGVVRAHASPLAVGPRPRLRPALEGAVSSVGQRLGGRSRIVEDHPMELVWGRRSPLTVLRETRVHASWQVSPSVVVHLNRRTAASPAALQARAASERAAPAPVPMRLVTLERQLETRVVGRALAALTESARQPADATGADPAPTLTAALQPARVRAVPDARIDVRVPAPKMAVARSPRLPAVAVAATAASGPAAAAAPAPRSSAVGMAPGTPPLPIDRITTEVVRALDSRLIAWRERMGRP